jgi:hypothetical protein
MPSIQYSLDKFNNLDPMVILTIDGDETAKNVEAVAQKNGIKTEPLSVALIFLATDEMTYAEIAPYLQDELQTSAETAKKIADDFIATVLTPLKKRLDFLNYDQSKEMTIEEERNYLSDMFLKKLTAELKNHPIVLDAINHHIFNILDLDAKFSDELVRMLLANDEILTAGAVLIGGKSLRGTVSNWLKNFIEINGSAIFDSVVLSKYLTGSKSAVKLNPEEKEKVRKVLLIYRNLKFFPDSMPDDDGEGWQILPFEIPAEEKNLAEARTKIESLPKQVADSAQDSKTSAATAPEEKAPEADNAKLEELRAMAEKYPPNSLSRKAIVEEIKKLEKK